MSGNTAGPVVWFEVMGQDSDKLRSFYGELFGWEFDTANPMNYGVVAAGEGGIGGGVGQAGPGHPGWITFYTQVDDIEAALEKARGLGSQVLMPVTKLETITVAVVSDPDGHPVGLCTPVAG
jgi:hypothetical protein